MPNPLCECPVAGFCTRHKMTKTGHAHQMCQGEAPTSDGGWKYWIAWERGLLGATAPANPVTNPPRFREASEVDGEIIPEALVPTFWEKKEGCCGGADATPQVIRDSVEYSGDGPGSELIKAYKAAGFPSCQACTLLAWKMDQWGAKVCEERIEEIIDDMLPRVKIWFKENHAFIHSWLPGVIQDAGFRFKLRSDIAAAIAVSRAS